MSASSKKKLRAAQEAEKLTEKQLAERKEAKKLKIYTTLFVVVLAAMVCVAAWLGISGTIKNSTLLMRNTVALTVGEHKITNDEMNYFFIDAVNNFNQQYGNVAAYFGLDVTKPLDQQIVDPENGTTWADTFETQAMESAKSTYALCDAAAAAGYTLTEDDTAKLENQLANLQLYALMNQISDVEIYLKALYGNAATMESYRAYIEANILAISYQQHYTDSLSYDEADLRAAEEENYDLYSAFSYHTYSLPVTAFREGGTTDENGKTVYSDEEKAAAEKMAEETAKVLTGEDITTVEALDEAIAGLPINSDKEASSTSYDDAAYNNINDLFRDWITDDSRVSGDTEYFANTSTDDAGNETVTSYTVVMFVGANDNNYPLANVRHILIPYEGGVKEGNNTVYSDEEKASAKATASRILNDWRLGDKTEESFAALAGEKSTDPGSKDNGGLYEDIVPGKMVDSFNDWCFAEGRKPGDTGLVMTEYGCHIMFYSGNSETLYRDYLIETDLRNTATTDWFNALIEALSVKEGSTRYLSRGLVIKPAEETK